MKNYENDNKTTAALYTLGCKVNQYESRAIAERLESFGVEIHNGGMCDIYIINTCAVTAESDRKSRQIIRRCISRNPNAVVAVCGCSSQLHREQISAIDGVDIVYGSSDKYTAADKAYELALLKKEYGRAKNKYSIVLAENTFNTAGAYDRGMTVSGFDRVRAYVKIEDGCNSSCAYCIIPKVRGPVRSRLPEDIIKEIATLADTGCREVVLTGLETSAYGYGLTGLLRSVDTMNGIDRIRLGSMDPSFLNSSFTDEIAALKHFMPHLHVSVQSGCSRTLAAMRRKYNAETALKNLSYIKKLIPEMRFSADIIVGFPGETEEDFNETLLFAEKAGFLHIHIFTYSKRPGTKAAEMANQVSEEQKNERAVKLSSLQSVIKKELLDFTVKEGKPALVLFESYKDGKISGHAEDFTEYVTAGDINLHGQLHKIKPISHDGNIISGLI
ncbi:MAG: tRNA (N(6)-L-threonylcarbamoyladenosine(37)-C(2))-methylthiotransferase MtaB [Eubacteriales bacterium]